MKKDLQPQKKYLSLHSQNNGAVAQMVEQWTENPCVGSSILPSTTFRPLTATCEGFFVPKFVPATRNKDIIDISGW